MECPRQVSCILVCFFYLPLQLDVVPLPIFDLVLCCDDSRLQLRVLVVVLHLSLGHFVKEGRCLCDEEVVILSQVLTEIEHHISHVHNLLFRLVDQFHGCVDFLFRQVEVVAQLNHTLHALRVLVLNLVEEIVPDVVIALALAKHYLHGFNSFCQMLDVNTLLVCLNRVLCLLLNERVKSLRNFVLGFKIDVLHLKVEDWIASALWHPTWLS